MTGRLMKSSAKFMVRPRPLLLPAAAATRAAASRALAVAAARRRRVTALPVVTCAPGVSRS